MTFPQRPEGGKGESHGDICRESRQRAGAASAKALRQEFYRCVENSKKAGGAGVRGRGKEWLEMRAPFGYCEHFSTSFCLTACFQFW